MLSNNSTLSSKKIFDEFFSSTHKRFGQNFIFDQKINKRIVSSAGDMVGKTIVEIGPGPGGLTLEILKKDIAKLYVVELDEHWAKVWNKLKPKFIEKLEVIHCDALNFNINDISPDIIISNLPYNISTQLLFKWLPEFHKYEQLILMFQKEVADRLYATHSTKNYGKLSVLCQWKSKVQKLFDLSPGCFFPRPKVKSTLVRFFPYKDDVDNLSYFISFSEMLTSLFSHRRKTVLKMLSKFLVDAEKILNEFGYTHTVRAEEISVDDYTKIYAIYKNRL